ncbi:MAG: sigma-70 family RNA polymerase sigma factor [Acidobacteriaceae bacterium]|nr:sigma-70 family RNA polymerase sigma factor [Acidobacteriaceae bacterium]
MHFEDEITKLISDWKRGDRQAESRLFDLLYVKLRQLAIQCLRDEVRCRTLSPTALVHEAYLRLSRSEDLKVTDRGHFLALTARVMQQILTDAARARQSGKRGGDPRRVELGEWMVRTDSEADEILAVDQALTELSKKFPRQAKLVQLHFFGGWSLEDAAEVIGVSQRTARREWQVARVRLKEAIDGRAAAD